MHIEPLRFKPAIAIEDLNTMLLPVGDIDPTICVAANIMRDVKMSYISDWFAPGKQEHTVW